MIGTTIQSRYTLTDLIGSGAMGDVYRAEDSQTGDTVAIKTLKPDLLRYDPGLLDRFRREGEALRDLNHPNIVTLLDVISEDDAQYLVMEYMPGGDLAALLADHPEGLPPERVVSIALEIADALTRAHHLSIIHRDLKPANVLIAEDGAPRLSDFGVALAIEGERLTDSKAIIGTMDYIAPEAINGEAIDTRADVWSFGVMVYEMLAGQRPFGGDTLVALFAGILTEPVPDLEALRPDCPVGLVDLIYRMLEKDPMARIPGVRHVGAALEDILHDRAPRIGSRFATPVPDRISLPVSNLPAQTTPFIGRDHELDTLAALLSDEMQRLITILGPGGMGKSRLAIELGLRQLDNFKDGAFFVDLAKINDPANIPAAIAEATGFPFSQQGTTEEQILNFLSNKHMLLTLDNFEHLLEGRDLVSAMLERGPDLRLLVTTRERLNMVEETVFSLDPLAFPDWETPEDALDYAAVQLFMQSAKRVRADFELQPDDLDYLARICRLVEGIPLGILLAASWVDTLSLAEIAEEIQTSIDFLESAGSNLPARQRSTRASFDYTWKLLRDEERSAFARMSVFRGGCTRQAAQEVTGTSLRMLTALVNKSLLRRDSESGRIHIHELLRQFGEEQLQSTGEADALRDAHMTYYLTALAEREDDLKGRDQIRALEDIDPDFENVRAAWLGAVDGKALDLIQPALTPFAIFCNMRTRLSEGREVLALVRDLIAGETSARARAIWARSVLRREMLYPLDRPLDQEQPVFEEIVSLARQTGDIGLEAHAHYALGWVHANADHPEAAIAEFNRSVVLFEARGDRYFQALSLHYVGFCYDMLDDRERDQSFYSRAADIRRSIGDWHGLSKTLNNIGASFNNIGESDNAERLYHESLDIARKVDLSLAGFVFMNLGWLYLLKLNQLTRARQVAEEAMMLANRYNNPVVTARTLNLMARLALLDEDYDRLDSISQQVLTMELSATDLGFALSGRIHAAKGRGDWQAAETLLKQLLDYRSVPGPRGSALHHKAFLLHRDGQSARAVQLVACVWSQPGNAVMESIPYPIDRRFFEDLKQTLGREEFDRMRRKGEMLDLDEEFEKEFGAWLQGDNA